MAKINKHLEKYYPIVCGLIAAFLCWKFGLDFFAFAQSKTWKIENIYSSVFDLSSIITAFVFGFFTFARASETRFIEEARHTDAFSRFMRFVLTSIYANALVVLTTVPLLVSNPSPNSDAGWDYYYCILWFGLSIFAIATTVRSLRLFIAIAMVEHRN